MRNYLRKMLKLLDSLRSISETWCWSTFSCLFCTFTIFSLTRFFFIIFNDSTFQKWRYSFFFQINQFSWRSNLFWWWFLKRWLCHNKIEIYHMRHYLITWQSIGKTRTFATFKRIIMWIFHDISRGRGSWLQKITITLALKPLILSCRSKNLRSEWHIFSRN